MNWEAIGAVGEILSAIAVLITLVYLAIQVRQNTHSMDETRKVELARNRTQTVQLRADWSLTEASSTETLEMYVRLQAAGWPDPISLKILSEVDLARLRRLQRANALTTMNAKYQYEAGLIDDNSYSSTRFVLKAMTPVWKELGLGRLLEPNDGQIGRHDELSG